MIVLGFSTSGPLKCPFRLFVLELADFEVLEKIDLMCAFYENLNSIQQRQDFYDR